MSKFIEVTVIDTLSDGSKMLDKMLVNSDSISFVYDNSKYDDWRVLVLKDNLNLHVKETYEELKEKLLG